VSLHLATLITVTPILTSVAVAVRVSNLLILKLAAAEQATITPMAIPN
jgi:hypothetical protein